jgi:fumarate reductase subunit C
MTSDTKPAPKEYMRPMSATWWLKRPAYVRFMIREVASIFIGGYCLFLMVLLYRAAQGTDAFRAFYESLQSPLSVSLHAVFLFFAVFHSVTFFNATPRVIVAFRGEEKVPDGVIAGAHYALWAVVSLLLLFLAWVA